MKTKDEFEAMLRTARNGVPCGCADCEEQRATLRLARLVPYLEVTQESCAGQQTLRLTQPIRVF